jgi:REP element-mobilizing transposase RayT
MATALQSCESPALVINSMPDHVHVLCQLSRKHAVCDVIEVVKKASSKWLKTKGRLLEKFYWQGGYGAFSVSPSNVASVRQYIEQQEEHHQRMSFQDELRVLLSKHGIEFDERYVWE